MANETTVDMLKKKSIAENLDEQINAIKKAQAADLNYVDEIEKAKKASEERLAGLSFAKREEIFKKQLELQEVLAQKELEKKNATIAEWVKKQKEELEGLNDLDKKNRIAAIEAEAEAKRKAAAADRQAKVDQAKKEAADKKNNLKKDLKNEEKERLKLNAKIASDSSKSLKERLAAIRDMSTTLNEDGTTSGGTSLAKGLAKYAGAKVKDGMANGAAKALNAALNFADSLNSTIDDIGKMKGAIDTRLQGSKGAKWDQMAKDLTGMAGANPLVKQSDLTAKVSQMVSQGIAFNVEQRAVIDVMKDKIASTFDAANGTLLRLVKIQQQDTTAARLGMESALTSFLNNMYETTEYMQGLANQVKSNLEEAMSLMTGENALSFEYQVQKWLGSMSSVGMSDSAVQGIAGVLGQIAAGQIEGLTGGGTSNLAIMAANDAGLNIADMMAKGLDDSDTNRLMESMVNYLAKIYNESGDSKVIQQQLANVYGLSASDLKAISNMAKDTGVLSRNGLSYSGAMSQLNSMAASMGSRTSAGEMLTNVEDNLKYAMAAGIATNPALYGVYKGFKMLKDLTGGIALPAISVMGSGVDLETTVADLGMTGAMAGGILSNLGMFGSAISNAFGGGTALLKAAGVNNGITTVSRGSGTGLVTTGGMSVSSSGAVVGNSDGNDVQNKTMGDANDNANNQLASAVEETDEVKLKVVDEHIQNIYEILYNFEQGFSTMRVSVENWPAGTETGGM